MAKNQINLKKAAKEFSEKWFGKGYEKGESQLFWIELLQKVYCVENISDFIVFEDKVHLDHTSFIDAYIPSTHVMIEQKSLGKDLRKPIKQSDGSSLTPFQQAKRYSSELPYSNRPRWIITCNFSEFLIYDMEMPQGEPVQIMLEDLPEKIDDLRFLVDSEKDLIPPETQISLKAGELVGKLYDALIKEYIPPTRLSRHSERSEESERSFTFVQDDKLSDLQLRSLNILCVRLVFLLYAEDAGVFAEKDMFGRYLAKFRPDEVRKNLMELFAVLNTKPEDRDPYLNDDLAAFPYVNGGLFAERSIEIPRFNEEIVDILVNKASAGFDWSKISPTIFGAVFESTLNPETRRKGGMHYTSIANIHKVIDPLFLDDLKAEFAQIVGTRHSERSVESQRDVSHSFNMTAKTKNRLEQFRNKLASLTFLDPACGSGNFLTETYISLRRLENECLKVIHGSQMLLSSKDFSPIKVKISQFYGIEINDFAVTVAKTALWIAESQMMKETEEIVDEDLDFLPLSTSATIVEGNALRMDWRYLHEEAEIPTITAKKTNLLYPFMVRESEPEYRASDTFSDKEHGFEYDEINLITNEINVGKTQHKQEANHYDYIMGNPPFVGYSLQSETQKKDILSVFTDEKGKSYKTAGKIDYVSGWYFKAAELIRGTNTRCAFVSTNSITQGEQVSGIWKPIFERFNIRFDFAWRTFRWDSESTQKARVHCVIIGFSCQENGNPHKPCIFNTDETLIEAANINGYLIDAPNIFVESREKSFCDVPQMVYGNKPADGGFLFLSEEEKVKFENKEPGSSKFIKQILGSEEFINNKKRYCLWLVGANPGEIKRLMLIMKRIESVRKFRLASSKEATRKSAELPALFQEIRQPESGNYLLVPRVSSERRRYIPIGFINHDVIVNDSVQIIPNATLYHFGVLTSSVHMAWMRAVCGRLEMRYRYSKDIVYNNFPWPDLSGSDTATSPKRRGKEYRDKIEQTAQAILDARAEYPDSSLADLYDENLMPPELRKAHKENDKAVMQAYGFSTKMSEAEIVAELFKMYEKLIKKI